jgi:hypothetical protein
MRCLQESRKTNVGWFTPGYAITDIAVGVVFGTSITDIIGAGIDNTDKNW